LRGVALRKRLGVEGASNGRKSVRLAPDSIWRTRASNSFAVRPLECALGRERPSEAPLPHTRRPETWVGASQLGEGAPSRPLGWPPDWDAARACACERAAHVIVAQTTPAPKHSPRPAGPHAPASHAARPRPPTNQLTWRPPPSFSGQFGRLTGRTGAPSSPEAGPIVASAQIGSPGIWAPRLAPRLAGGKPGGKSGPKGQLECACAARRPNCSACGAGRARQLAS